jgi:hypothetical protein
MPVAVAGAAIIDGASVAGAHYLCKKYNLESLAMIIPADIATGIVVLVPSVCVSFYLTDIVDRLLPSSRRRN